MLWLLFLSLAFGESFKTFVSSGPTSFDPAHFYGTESNYIFHNIYRGLYRFDDEKGLVPEGAKKCTWVSSDLICDLNPKVKWSDGQVVLADDYVTAFRYLMDPDTKSREVTPLINLKNAEKILQGKVSVQKLGVQAISNSKLKFTFERKDSEFLEKLTSPILVPWKVKPLLDQPESLISNGPYIVETFIKDQKIVLKPNPYYPFGNPKRPPVEFLFLSEDSTGQNLFDAGKIDLQHRVDVTLIPSLKDKPGFYQKVFSRFDFMGFGPNLVKDKNLRIAMTHALDYEELSKMLHAAGRPGCIGLTQAFSSQICYDFDLKKAKQAFEKVPQEFKEKRYILKFSRAGGDNVARIMEWYQHQLKKHLGLIVDLESIEQGMYLRSIYDSPPDLFRKGINLDRPTCTSALESFQSESKDNYVRFKSKNFDKKLAALEKDSNIRSKRKKCESLIQDLMNEYVMIPQGIIHYTMISNNKFKGWKFNELNQLDLSHLEYMTQKPADDKK